MDRQLIDYLPPVLAGTKEMAAIMASEQPEVEALWDTLRVVLDAGFVQTAGSKGLSRWEKIIGIRPKGTDTLDVRRIRIITRMNERLPYTMRVLCQMLTAICGPDGYRVRLFADKYTLWVRVSLHHLESYEDVRSMLSRVLPANIYLDLSPDYNIYRDLLPYTFRQLSGYTYRQLREDESLRRDRI